jgi:hypothetical protein
MTKGDGVVRQSGFHGDGVHKKRMEPTGTMSKAYQYYHQVADQSNEAARDALAYCNEN